MQEVVHLTLLAAAACVQYAEEGDKRKRAANRTSSLIKRTRVNSHGGGSEAVLRPSTALC